MCFGECVAKFTRLQLSHKLQNLIELRIISDGEPSSGKFPLDLVSIIKAYPTLQYCHLCIVSEEMHKRTSTGEWQKLRSINYRLPLSIQLAFLSVIDFKTVAAQAPLDCHVISHIFQFACAPSLHVGVEKRQVLPRNDY